MIENVEMVMRKTPLFASPTEQEMHALARFAARGNRRTVATE